MAETVNHPEHRHPAGIECVDVAEAFNFNIGNAIKYLWRAGLKTDEVIEDLRKARWYVAREIERAQRSQGIDPDATSVTDVTMTFGRHAPTGIEEIDFELDGARTLDDVLKERGGK